MYLRKPMYKAVAIAMAVTLFWLHAPVHLAVAAMIETETVIQSEQQIASRERLAALLDREDVQAGLRAHGIDPREAQARVSALTDAEVEMIVGQLDQLPAGGDALVAILVIAVLVFFILLATDIAGYTNIFPFVKHGAGR